MNVGPIKISEVFIGNADKYDKEDIKKLRESIHNFLILCGRAVELNGKLIKEDQQEFQNSLEQGYKEIKQQMLGKYPNKNLQLYASMSISTKNLLTLFQNKDSEEKSKTELISEMPSISVSGVKEIGSSAGTPAELDKSTDKEEEEPASKE